MPRRSLAHGLEAATERAARAAGRLLAPPPALGVAISVAVAFGCHLVFHAHGWRWPAFMNRDVAGIVYNARLLLEGSLPYLGSLEVKPPGAFFLVAPGVAAGGLAGLWWWGVVWATATSAATGWLAASLFGPRFFGRAVVLHAACLPLMSDGDVNYTFWMTLPATLSVALAARAWHVSAPRSFVTLWAGAGAALVLATLTKPSAAPLAGVLLLLLALEGRRRGWQHALGGALSLPVGGALAVGAFAAPYLLTGQLRGAVEGHAAAGMFATEYVDVVVAGFGGGATGALLAAFHGAQCLPLQVPAALALGAAGLLPVRRAESTDGPALSGALAVASLVGVSLTLRFYTHDTAQLAPALTLLTVRPGGLPGFVLEWASRKRVLASAMALSAGLLATVRDLPALSALQCYLHDTDRVVQRVCDGLRPVLPEGQPVVAWGWASWSVYEHCRRRAPGPVYKELATVTTVNSNTCNQGFGRMDLRAGAHAARWLEDLARNPPSLILWSDYYAGMGGDPLDDWPEATAFLEREYRIVHGEHPVVAYLRRDLPAAPIRRLPEPWRDPPPSRPRPPLLASLPVHPPLLAPRELEVRPPLLPLDDASSWLEGWLDDWLPEADDARVASP